MSTKPNPVAHTACMLTMRNIDAGGKYSQSGDGIKLAVLASALHRLAPACKRQAEAECNGEFFDGQRERMKWKGNDVKALEVEISRYGDRLDRRIAKINETLKPLAIEAYRTGDPRGWTLRLKSTDPNRPLPHNGWDDECWGIG